MAGCGLIFKREVTFKSAMDEQSLHSPLHTLSPPLPTESGDPMERSLGLSLGAFPLLRAALQQHGAVLRSELLEFAHALHYKRAPRVKRNLMARIHLADSDVPEVAVIRDLSATGARLWVDGDRAFNAASTDTYEVEIRVPASRSYVSTFARLVRVADNHRGRGVELAFSFTDETDPTQVEHLLAQVRNAAQPSLPPLALLVGKAQGCPEQAGPTGEQQQPAEGGDRAEHADPGDGHHVEAARE